jgi:hypothetical protein
VGIYFKNPHRIYWAGEFEDIVNAFKGQNIKGEYIHDPMYTTNVEALVLAAAIGLKHGRYSNLVTEDRREIMYDTFESQPLAKLKNEGGVKCVWYMVLLAIIYRGDEKIMEDGKENEEELVSTFEKLAHGGLEYLRGLSSTNNDPTFQTVLYKEVHDSMENLNKNDSKGLVNLFSI